MQTIAPIDLLNHWADFLNRTRGVRLGLFTDIDGTISPMVPTFHEAGVSPRCRTALASLAGKLPLVAAVTGRDIPTARDMIGLDGLVYVGNHGLERWSRGELHVAEEAESYRGRMAALAKRLREGLALPGIAVEDKGVSLAVHYRSAQDWETARHSILSTLKELDTGNWLEVQPGKAVLNLRPAIGLDKGTAISTLAREYALGGAIVLGDDMTDLDGFHTVHRLARERSFLDLSVAVVGEETPEELERQAAYRLRGVEEVEVFLTKLDQALVEAP